MNFRDRLKETTEKLKSLGTLPDALDKKINATVERATSEMWINPDWGLNMELVDVVNTNQSPACFEKCFRSLRKRLSNRNPKVQVLTLTLLETCVKNCGASFQGALGQSELWTDVVRLGDPKRKADLQVQDKVLIMVEDFSRSLRPQEFHRSYNDMVTMGVRFPERPPDEVGAGIVSPPPSVPQEMVGVSEADQKAIQEALQDLASQDRTQGHPEPTAVATGTGQTVARGVPLESEVSDPTSPEEIEKVKADIQVSRNSMELLKDAIGSIPANEPEQVNAEFIRELAEQCNGMKPRLTRLVQAATDEEILGSALVLHEDLTALLVRYDELVARASLGQQPVVQGTPASAPAQPLPDLLPNDSEAAEATLISNRRPTPPPVSHPAPQSTNPMDLLMELDSTLSYPTTQVVSGSQSDKPQDAFAELAAERVQPGTTTDEFDQLVASRNRAGTTSTSMGDTDEFDALIQTRVGGQEGPQGNANAGQAPAASEQLPPAVPPPPQAQGQTAPGSRQKEDGVGDLISF